MASIFNVRALLKDADSNRFPSWREDFLEEPKFGKQNLKFSYQLHSIVPKSSLGKIIGAQQFAISQYLDFFADLGGTKWIWRNG